MGHSILEMKTVDKCVVRDENSGQKMFLLCGGVLILLSLQRVVSADCEIELLPCDSGAQCIYRDQWCDEELNCEDGSDEAYCKKKKIWNSDPNECNDKQYTHFKCDTGVCFPKITECDGYTECKDGSDEKYCEMTEMITGKFDDFEEEHSSRKIENETSSAPPTHFTTQPKVDEEVFSSTTATVVSLPSFQANVTSRFDLRPTVDENIIKEGDPRANRRVTAHDLGERETTKYVPPSQLTTPVSNQRQFNNVSPITRNSYYPPFLVTTSIPHQRQFNHFTSIYSSSNIHQQTTIRRIRPPLFVNVPSSASHGNRRTNVHHSSTNRGYANYDSYHKPKKNLKKEWKPYEGKRTTKIPFYFAKDYAKLYGAVNANSILEGERWLLQQRSKTDDWGDNSGRALIALALNRNGYRSGDHESELMKRRFIVKLGTDIIRNRTKAFNVNRLTTSILALLAICEDPRDFHGLDLIEVLQKKVHKRIKDHQYVNPRVYLPLCLSNRSLSMQEMQNLKNQMMPAHPLNERTKDMQSLAIQTFACNMQVISREDPAYRWSQEALSNAVSSLIQRMYEDGSFGSVYSTALAAQALISTGEANNWNSAQTMAFLRQQQNNDGSFGDMLATYLTLPALSGKSALHLRNIHCNASSEAVASPSEALEFAGPKQYIHYSIYFGNPLVNSHSIRVLVPRGISFLDVMKVAESQDANYRYAYEDREPIYLYSLSGMPNDAERGLSWHLHVKQESDPNQKDLNWSQLYDGDLRHFHPRASQHVIFWYHHDGLRRK